MRYKSWIYLLIVSFSLGACNDFLEESSQTEVRPSTVKDMEKLLEGEAYPSQNDGETLNWLTNYLTDDYACRDVPFSQAVEAENAANYRCRYAWETNMFDEAGFGAADNNCWYIPYERIKGANVILDYLDGIREGDERKKEHIRGEAYALRGYYYLMLTNFFGMPYNQGNPEEHKAVPLKLYSGVTTDFDELTRSSVAECYEQIERDLLEGTRLMREYQDARSVKPERMTYLTGYALLSRMYLYMADYDRALAYADSVLNARPELLDMKANTAIGVYFTTGSPEILWTIPQYVNLSTFIAKGHPFYPSDELLALYKEGSVGISMDLRGDYDYATWGGSTPMGSFFRKGNVTVQVEGVYVRHSFPADPIKGNFPSASEFYTGGIRVAEMYLTRAEVYCRRFVETGNSGDAQKALDDLNLLREHRFAAGYVAYTLTDFTSADELLDFCLRERRRELVGEANSRWFDLRRLGMPELRHHYVHPVSEVESDYVLPAGDTRYALPIPEEVWERNPNLR